MKKPSSTLLSMSFVSIYVLAFMMLSCENPLSENIDDFGKLSFIESMSDWSGYSSASHSEYADADYGKLFNDEKVQRIDIVIDNDYYELMEEDMVELYGTYGSGGGMSTSDSDPMYAPVTVSFSPADGSDEERTWWYVGMRYKGNSSLRDSWQEGMHKLPFRLNFDKFDYIYEEIEGQRFWGFEKMTFSNGKNDDSLIRDKIAADFYKEAGVEVAEVAFCRVYINVGDGPVYWGLYSMIEDPSDQMLHEQFTDGSGNLYKPDDEYNSTLEYFDEDLYEKKTNEDEDDWTDVKALITALDNDDEPTSTEDANWQSDLEAVFDVEKFLDYMAINNFIKNWDVYGSKAHNFYLYGNPVDSGKLTWIPWDLNESFTLSTSSFNSMCLSLNDESIDYDNNDWPLLYYVMHQDKYITYYKSKLEEYFYDITNGESLFSTSDTSYSTTEMAGTFTTINTIEEQMQTYSNLISDYVIGDENGEIDGYTWLDNNSDFTTGLVSLKSLVSDRFDSAKSYLGY